MSHWIIAPILVPLLTAMALLLVTRRSLTFQRVLALGTTLALLAISIALLRTAAAGGYGVYALGDWPAPFGIVLVLDRLSAYMIALASVVALAGLLFAMRGTDARGRNFHVLFQLQLVGLNGAFLTGDLFNLFVFFEILLIASYGLVLHGGGTRRVQADLAYVVLNLVGSSVFLVAVGVLYGVAGTLNMADLALRVAAAPASDAALLHAAALLLLVVFSLKAALLPLYFWLPPAYSAATAPVAALFAIMTKVGVYGVLRLFTLVFGPQGGAVANVAMPWLVPLALATLALGTLGALASTRLRVLVAYLVIASAGTMMTAVGLFSTSGLSAALYYMAHSTLVLAALFLLAELVSRQRGEHSDRLDSGPVLSDAPVLGALFFTAAVAIAGVPPLSGFLGKLMLLQAAPPQPLGYWVWGVVLGTGLLAVVGLSRAGSALFWRTQPGGGTPQPAHPLELAPILLLLGSSLLLTVLAQPVVTFTHAAARQLLAPQGYIEGVLGATPRVGASTWAP